MQFLRTVFWVVVAVVAVLFSVANWVPVDVSLWGGLIWSPPLPFLIIIAFSLGLIPTLVWQRAVQWSLKRRLDAATRAFGTMPAHSLPAETPIRAETPAPAPIYTPPQ